MESRQSRRQKNYVRNTYINKEGNKPLTRVRKNSDLYREVDNLEIKGFDLNSNAQVIGENTDNISLDEVRDILSKTYKKDNKNRSIGDTTEVSLPKINLDETREYDINAILEKARDKKEVNYEEDRLREIKSTQEDILKTIEDMQDEYVSTDSEEVNEELTNKKKEDARLKDLINTINAKELIENEKDLEVTGEMDPFALLGSLKGDDENTRVMGALDVDELLGESEEENKRVLSSKDKDIYDDDMVDQSLEYDEEEDLPYEDEEDEDEEDLPYEEDEDEEDESLEDDSTLDDDSYEENIDSILEDDTGNVATSYDDEEDIEDDDTSEDDEEDLPYEDEEDEEEDEEESSLDETVSEPISVQQIKEESLHDNREYGKMDLDKSFIGNTTVIDESDFGDDFDDLKDNGIGKTIVKVLVVLILIAFAVGIVFILKGNIK